MNLLIISYEYPPIGGGGGVATKNLADELVKMGHEVSVLTVGDGNWFLKKSEDGVKIYRLPSWFRNSNSEAGLISMFLWPFLSIPAGIFICLKNKFDVINTQFFAPTGPTGMILSFLFRIPNYIYGHGADIYDPDRLGKTPSGRGLLPMLLRISMRLQAIQARSIAVQSKDTEKRLLKLIPDFHHKISVIPLIFTQPHFDEMELDKSSHEGKNNFRLVSIGRLVKRKGFDYLIEAISKINSDKIHLKIVGDGPEKGFLQSKIDEFGAENKVKLTGWVSEEEKYSILAQSDCYVLSSLHEGMGIVLQEAMYVGLSVVATNYGGQTDLIEDKKGGILVDPANSDQLKNAIEWMLNHPDDRENMGKVNKKNVERYFGENLVGVYVNWLGGLRSKVNSV